MVRLYMRFRFRLYARFRFRLYARLGRLDTRHRFVFGFAKFSILMRLQDT